MTDVLYYPATALEDPARSLDERALADQNEMAAFEKGRMQGEMEAIRRMENENSLQLKQFPAENLTLGAVSTIPVPDIVELAPLTFIQRLAAFTGEAAIIASFTLVAVWVQEYRGGMTWTYSGDNRGNQQLWNAGFFALNIGMLLLSQAVLLYRLLPMNTNPWINRVLYLFFYSSAIVSFVIALVARIRSTPEMIFWASDDWCLSAAMAFCLIHGAYSMCRTLLSGLAPVTYEDWAEVNNKVTTSNYNPSMRTVYAPAPVALSTITTADAGADGVPAAPSNAPRWAENPNTHAENYFLMPAARWGLVGYIGMGAATLMTIAAIQHIIATDHQNWSQDQPLPDNQVGENSSNAKIMSAAGVLLLCAVILITFAAMPPKATLVKNGIAVDASRRGSISHNAETRIGNVV